jgi:peptidoglycan/LPS O-acetylase OafA/YrhL
MSMSLHLNSMVNRAVPQASSVAYDRYIATSMFGGLDGLRAIAIIAVVWHHTHDGFAWAATRRGFLGVDLFFVISGFLIVTLLLREQRRNGNISLGAFYVRRSLRIFPLYYSTLLLLWVASWYAANVGPEIRTGLPYALTYTSNWVHLSGMLAITWSLSAEEQFYLFWPSVERFFRGQTVRLLCAMLLLFVTIQIVNGHFLPLDTWPEFLTAASFTPILLGVGLAHAMNSRLVFQKLWPVVGHRYAALFAFTAIAGLLSIPMADISGVPRLMVHLSFVFLVGTCVVREDNSLARLLRTPWLVRIGTVSYGIYLLHHIARYFVLKLQDKLHAPGDAVLFAGCLLTSWAAAELSFRYFESPFLRLKHLWTR